MPYRSLVSFALLALACAPKPADTEGDAGTDGSTGGAEATSAPSTDPGSATDAPTGDTPTTFMSSPDATGDSMEPGQTVTSANPTTPDPPDDPPPPGGLPGACAELCVALSGCGLAPGGEQCEAGCVAEEDPGTACAMLLAAHFFCLADLNCAELEQDEPAGCAAELAAYDNQCDDAGCGMFAGGGPDFCSVGRECGDLFEEYRCEGDTCTCLENDVPGESCPNMDFCAGEPGTPEQHAAAQECCGWDWS